MLYILWDDWPIFMISASNEHLHQQLEYTLLRPDRHSWWISKRKSDPLEEWYALKFCFELRKHSTETYGMLHSAFPPSCINWESVFEWHKRFKEGRESVRYDVRYGRSKEVNTPELIGQRVRVSFYYGEVLMECRKRFRRKHQQSSNRVSGISTRTMHQSPTPSLSQTIWPR